MIDKKITALALATVLALTPGVVFAQEETGEAAEEGIDLGPFGTVSPVVAGVAAVVAAAIGIGVAVSGGGGKNEVGTGGTGGTSGTQ